MRCLALFTGGLDSQIAVRLMQRQGIEVVGVHISSDFSHPSNLTAAIEAAGRLQIRLQSMWDFKLLPLVRRPLFGFAEGMAPCLDCRSAMVARVREMLEPMEASFIISGEVVGQRPSSLRSRDLETIAYHADAEDLLLRPLSAQLLPMTLPERNGWVDRAQLFGWHGKGRKEQLALAKDWNLEINPRHHAGCLLLEPTFAARLRRTLAQRSELTYAEIQSLSLGRHFWTAVAHLVIARRHEEGETLRMVAKVDQEQTALLEPDNYRGPVALLFGTADVVTLRAAARIIGEYSKPADADSERWLSVTGSSAQKIRIPRQDDAPGDVHFSGLND